MEKIPTSVIVGGGAVLALLVVSKLASGSSGPGIRTLGPVAGVADQQAIAADQNKTQGFSTLVNAVTSLDLVQAQIAGAFNMEQLRAGTLININDATNAAQAQRDKVAADLERTRGANQLAAQRSAAKSNFWSNLIGGAVNVIGHLFG